MNDISGFHIGGKSKRERRTNPLPVACGSGCPAQRRGVVENSCWPTPPHKLTPPQKKSELRILNLRFQLASRSNFGKCFCTSEKIRCRPASGKFQKRMHSQLGGGGMPEHAFKKKNDIKNSVSNLSLRAVAVFLVHSAFGAYSSFSFRSGRIIDSSFRRAQNRPPQVPQ